MKTALAVLACLVASAATAETLPALTGTLIAPGARVATFQFRTTAAQVSVGDSLGPWRIQRIDPGKVRLTGPEGTIDVGLHSGSTVEPPGDSGWLNPCGRLHPRIAGARGRDHIACRTALANQGEP